jgi:hypothetical protein
MAKATTKKKINGYRLSLFICLGALAALGAAALILGLIPVNSGVRTEDRAESFQISKQSFVMSRDSTDNSESFSGEVSADKEQYDKIAKEYRSMTGFTCLRGVLEGVGAPKARFDAKVKSSVVKDLIRTDKNEYFIFVRYAAKQEKTFKDADGKEQSVEFDRVAVRVEDTNIIEKHKVDAYLFVEEDFDNVDYRAAKILITANQANIYAFCDGLFK